jgi:hypothetical protein
LTNVEFHELTAVTFGLRKQHFGIQINRANQAKTVD